MMDAVQRRIFILYTIIKKKNQTPKVCSKKNFLNHNFGFCRYFD